MAFYNKIILIGNATRDCELRFTPQGAAVAECGLAVNRKYTDGKGEKREEVLFINVVAWGKMAENVFGKYVKKGTSLLVDGYLKLETWEKDGEKKSTFKVIAENVSLLGGGQQKENAPAKENKPKAGSPEDMESEDCPF